MSCKGISVTAARMLIDRTCARYAIPLLILHDFDVSGFSIAKTVCSDTRRYAFRSEFRTIDLGLRLADVEELDLEAEPVSFGNTSPDKIRDRLKLNGATPEEIDFLLEGQRVELNAMTSDQFVAFVERKLTEAGIAKVVPPKDQLEEVYRLFARSKQIEEIVEKEIAALIVPKSPSTRISKPGSAPISPSIRMSPGRPPCGTRWTVPNERAPFPRGHRQGARWRSLWQVCPCARTRP
jgi:hypothetical protein